jgi:hypothetical protein
MEVVAKELERARTALAAAQALIRDEIAAYPAPVAGCDAQFNHLLALRRNVQAALAELDREPR